ncbi:MAG: winged helix-turn-helix transcriptional regulator [Thaumarchaeota archaeon]|nr:winged helix-turn-helix transcriptional regulator [Nitrososphaerota archaeon]
MSQAKKFGEQDLISALGEIGSKLKAKISVYLIGGCAMTFMGAKAATKDIDVVATSHHDASLLIDVMKDSGFVRVNLPGKEYRSLDATAIMERPNKMRFDIFTRKVCGKLEIGEKMQSRAAVYRTFGNLEVCLMSGEDILLFKGMTDRMADLDDMLVLVQRGIDWSIVRDECFSQNKSAQWADLLGTKLLDLRERHGIRTPIIKEILDKADMDLLERSFRKILGDREMNFKEIADAVLQRFGYSQSWTRNQIKVLEKRGKIKRRKEGRKNLFFMK